MLMDIVRFEWRYHTRQISFIAAAALFFLFGFIVDQEPRSAAVDPYICRIDRNRFDNSKNVVGK